jgi:Tfp pilus assembly protein PilF
VAYEQLLRESWYHAPDLRSRYFELLSRTRRLDAELASLRTMKPDPEVNPAAARMLAEGEVWKTNYEAAAQPFRLLAASLPAEPALDERAASLHRSLNRADLAVQIESNLAKADPRNREILTRIGEIDADRERYDKAAVPWVKMASLEPGKPEGYLDAATVFWDYFQFNDAIKMIEQARAKLGNPSLYAYEEAAIRENQRDYAAALNEYAKGALSEGAGRCRERLLRLAKRPALAAQAEVLTKRIGASQTPANIALRIAFLEGQNRAADLQQYLSDTLAAATSTDVIATVENSARTNEMNGVLRQVLERKIALTQDPVDKLRARVELARFFEAQGDSARAGQTIEALYRENPTTYATIRNAVNYYWRNKQESKAVDLLVASADRAQPPYQDQFRFEAAQKAIESRAYDRGQQLITALLDKEPYRADYLAVSGDLYAKRGDDPGLRTYYLNTIESLRKSPLSADERISRVASLRRSLIPVLIRLKDFTGAVDQYIEVINRYPEDEGPVREAALFAIQNRQRQRLTDFYVKTAAGASRDHRWPIVLSRIETQAENLPGALEWLGKARAIRPERTDFLAAKGPLEERLMRFEDAAKTYTMLWELSYHDPSWMVKAAEQYERLGRHSDTLSALNKAFIEGRPESPGNYLSAATQANQWNLLDAANDYVQKGLTLNSKTDPKYAGLQALDVTLVTRRHSAMPAPSKDLDPAVAAKWGEAVAKYSTPEEKAALATKLTPAATGKAIATAAGFAELLTKWEAELTQGAANPQWVALEKLRGKIDEIGPRLEAAAKNGTLSGQQRDALLAAAREYYAQAGNAQAELRLLEQRRASGMRDNAFIARYAELAARDQKQALAIVASDPTTALRDAVANRLLSNGRASDALAVIQARGTAFKPVWTKAYTALAGVYFDIRTPQVRTAFEGVLGPQLIGEQLGKQPDEEQQVAGAPWYYYAARYGEYLTSGDDPAGEDYMLARLEASPASAAAYAELADFYLEKRDFPRALAEYDYVLQLDPASPGPHLRKASILAASGNTAGATEEWKPAFAGFERELDGKPSPTWWTEMAQALTDIGRYKMFPTLRDDASRVLRTHFKRNGAYNAEILMQPVVNTGGAEWLFELCRTAPEPNQVLDVALQGMLLTSAQRDQVYAKEVEFAQAKASTALGANKPYLQENVVNLQLQRIRDAMTHGNMATAERLLQELPAKILETYTTELAAIQIRISARRGTLSELLAKYQRDPQHSPTADILQKAATELREAKDEKNANVVLEFLYNRELANRNFTGPNFLGLAEVKLANNDLPAALELLRRMNLMVGAPFELLNDSGNLLWRTGHLNEAAQYFEQLVKVQPWEPAYRLSLARVKHDSVDVFAAIAKDSVAPYATRVEAATQIHKAGGLDGLNSGAPELDLIAGKPLVTETQANQPFYLPLRLMVAAATKDPAVRFRLLAAAVSSSPNGPGQPRLQLLLSAVETKRWFLANSLIEDGVTDPSLLRSLIEVKRQVGEPAAVIQYQTQLAALLPDGDAKRTLEAAVKAQEQESTRRTENDARMPVISEALQPDRIVKPRLAGGVQ